MKRLYVEVSSNIDKEFYLSCLVDRASSKIAFISSDQGGMDIEEVASKTPEKIITTKIDISDEILDNDCEKIIEIFSLKNEAKNQAISLIKSIYKMFISTDASMVEINPLILTKEEKIICLDAKVNFDDNALFKHPDIVDLRDLNEEDPIEIEASKNSLSYIKLNGSILHLDHNKHDRSGTPKNWQNDYKNDNNWGFNNRSLKKIKTRVGKCARKKNALVYYRKKSRIQ